MIRKDASCVTLEDQIEWFLDELFLETFDDYVKRAETDRRVMWELYASSWIYIYGPIPPNISKEEKFLYKLGDQFRKYKTPSLLLLINQLGTQINQYKSHLRQEKVNKNDFFD